MRKNVSRSQLTWIGALAALACLGAWSRSQLAAGRQAAQAAAEDLAECQRLADEITRLGTRPQKASLEARSATELAKLVEQSAQAAALPQQALVQIDPQPARRVGETAYREQATRLELRDVTLRQLVTFLHGLSHDDLGMEVSDLRLRAPRDDKSVQPTDETWTAEVTLTHLIFAP